VLGKRNHEFESNLFRQKFLFPSKIGPFRLAAPEQNLINGFRRDAMANLLVYIRAKSDGKRNYYPAPLVPDLTTGY